MSYWPGTQIERSTNNGFTLGLSESSANWKKLLVRSAAQKDKSSAQVDRQRKDGKEFGAYNITVISSAPKRMKKPSKVSKAQMLRDCLASGPMTCRQLADKLGLKHSLVPRLLQHDFKNGTVVKMTGYTPMLVCLGSTE